MGLTSKIYLSISLCFNLFLLIHSDPGFAQIAINKSMAKEINLHKQDNGKKIRVHVDDVIKLQLEYPGGTGYSWYLDDLDSRHIALLQENTKSGDTAGTVGTPVSMTWKFEAKSKGRTCINLNLYRVWEGKKKAIDAFKINIKINQSIE